MPLKLTCDVLGLRRPINKVWSGSPLTCLFGTYSECKALKMARSWGSLSVPNIT